MLNSLAHSNHDKLESLTNTAKVVIINENGHIDHPLIVSRLKPVSKFNYKLFDYAQISLSGKYLNIYECTEDFSEMFLSERNLVVITFRALDGIINEEKIGLSIMKRLMKVLNKNIVPVSLMILSLGICEEKCMQRISEKVLEKINKLQADLGASINKFME